MSKTLAYSKSQKRPIPQWLVWAVRVSLLYPPVFLACLYGEFLLAWLLLGRQPWPMMDDPKLIGGSNWLHPIVMFLGAGIFPGVLAALAFNVIYLVLARPPGGRWVGQILGLIFVWVAAFVILAWDPGRVVEWWLD